LSAQAAGRRSPGCIPGSPSQPPEGGPG